MSGMDKTPYREFARDKLGFEFENIDILSFREVILNPYLKI